MLHMRIWISCDGGGPQTICPATFALEGIQITPPWVQAHARDHGWVRRGGLDLCPDHA